MRTLASELGLHAGRIAGLPRLYVDANVPAGLVTFMRTRLRWDVLFVIEHNELRRARDGEHFRLARELRRTLITLDRDYLDDRRFPRAESGGVLVLAAPHERGLTTLLVRLDKEVFRSAERVDVPGEGPREPTASLPLEGRTLHVHIDWQGPLTR